MSEYRDHTLTVDDDGITLRWYYFPFGTKRIPFARLRSVTRADIGAMTGRGRIWGTANPRYWANLDVNRPKKTTGYVLDTGRFVRPFVTPDEPGAFEAALSEHGLTVTDGGRTIL